MKLRPNKCELFKRQVRYVGRLVTSEGVQIDPKDLEAVLQLKEREPKNVGEVRALLGFLGYYRSFIQDFSRIARPLFKLQESPVGMTYNLLHREPPKILQRTNLAGCLLGHPFNGLPNTVL